MLKTVNVLYNIRLFDFNNYLITHTCTTVNNKCVVFLGARQEQDIYVRLIDSVTKQVCVILFN